MNYFSRSKIFLYIMISFCVGVFFSPYIFPFINGVPIIVKILNCYTVIFVLFILRKNRLVLFSIVFLVSCLVGAWRYQAYLPKIDENHVGFYNDNKETYLISGMVNTEPTEKDSSLSLQISNIQYLLSNREKKRLNGKILLTVPRYFPVEYGDRVQFKAKLAAPKEYDTFDYADYLARYGVYSIAKNVDEFQELEYGKGSFILDTLYKIKNYFSSVIKKIYPEPHAALMLGILLGAKASLPDWLRKIFQIIGITHIIAISGYNITILARVAEKTLGRIGRKYIFWGVIAMILSFVIMTGASASVVRAGVMGGLLVYAGFIGRKSNIINALVFAGTIMIFLNPLILKNDIGFQLSFLATLGLVYVSPIFELWLKKIPEFFRVLLSATLAAQVFTMPIIISNFGLLSLISPVANVLVLPFIPISMFLGFTSGLAGMIFLPLGRAIGFLGYMVLEIVIKISQFLASIPYASVELKINNWFFWGIYYVAVGALVWFWYKRKPQILMTNAQSSLKSK